ncbi:hypothetical protein OAF83_03790, partial [Rubripirellula sp.]
MDQLSESELIILSGCAVAGFLFLMATLWLTRRNRVQERLDELSQESVSSSTESGTGGAKRTRGTGKKIKDDEQNGNLIDRIMQAGLYRPQMIAIYQTVRFALSLIPGVLVFIAFQSSMISLLWAVVMGVGACLFGFLAPSLWLDYKKAGRQTTLRRALPDALDVIIICVEAGLSVQAAMAKVSRELASVHPLLAAEMAICQREIQLGASAGEALNHLAQRFD